jgi:hypothetical protein
VIPHRSGDDLTGTGTVAVHNQSQRIRSRICPRHTVHLILILISAASRHNDPGSDKSFGHRRGRIQKSAWVTTQIQHQRLQPFPLKASERGIQFLHRVLLKSLHADVSDAALTIQHAAPGDTANLHSTSRKITRVILIVRRNP